MVKDRVQMIPWGNKEEVIDIGIPIVPWAEKVQKMKKKIKKLKRKNKKLKKKLKWYHDRWASDILSNTMKEKTRWKD